MKGRIELNNMIFFAHHGCFEEERIIGNKFIVDLGVELDVSKPSYTDNIEDALNYQILYDIVKSEMKISSHLLENLASRILEKLKDKFPNTDKITISIAKQNPPLGGEVGASKITISI